MEILHLVKAAPQYLLEPYVDLFHFAMTTVSRKTPSGSQQTPTECILGILALRLALSMVP
jgi:hypothetical protein